MTLFKRVVSIVFRIGISIALLVFLFKQVDKKSLFEIISNADKFYLVMAFCIFFFINVLCLFRWVMLLKAANIHLPLTRVVMSFSGGVFFNLFLPSTIGGDLMRSIDLATHTRKPSEVIATVLLDRLSGYAGLVILAVLASSLGYGFVQDKSVLFSVGIIAAILIGILLVLFNKFFYSRINKLLHSPGAGKIRELIKNLHNEMHIFRHRKKVVVENLLLSILIQAGSHITFFIIGLSLGIKINIIYFFIFLPIVSAITLLPISIGGLGLRDATIIYFFAKVGVARDLSFAMSLINFSFILVFGILGGLVYVFTVHHRRVQYKQTPALHPHA